MMENKKADRSLLSEVNLTSETSDLTNIKETQSSSLFFMSYFLLLFILVVTVNFFGYYLVKNFEFLYLSLSGYIS